MALRLSNKIHIGIIQNFCRYLSAKPDLGSASANKEVAEDEAPGPKTQIYSLGQMQSLNLNKKFDNQLTSEHELARRHIENQSLQPSMLPNYYQNPMELNLPFTGENATDSQFKKSSTYSKVTLPLRPSKLAKPFPDPVKVMQSHTVSDEEKAAQMLADSRSTSKLSSKDPSSFNLMQTRSFSTSSYLSKKKGSSSDTVSMDPRKCKKVQRTVGKKMCRKMKLPGCEAPKRKSCSRKSLIVKCKKQEAPYPSYSESCHEDPDRKPSECRMCPWKPMEHPYFKAPRKKFHTALAERAKILTESTASGNKKVQKEDEGHKQEGENFPEVSYDLRSDGTTNNSFFQTDGSNFGEGAEQTCTTLEPEPVYKCDLRKKPCKRPRQRSCSERGKKKKKRGKRRGRKKGRKHKKKQKKKKRGGRRANKKRRRRKKGNKRRKGKRGRRGRKGKKKNRRNRRKKRTMGWTEAAKLWAEREHNLPEVNAGSLAEEHHSSHDQVRPNAYSSQLINNEQWPTNFSSRGNKNKRGVISWNEAVKIWAGRAQSVPNVSVSDVAQDFLEEPMFDDVDPGNLGGMYCRKSRRGRKGKKRKNKKRKGKGKKNKGKKKKKKGGKCKKFPYKKCPTSKRRKIRKRKDSKCPSKKKKKRIKDCPPEDDDKGCRAAPRALLDNFGTACILPSKTQFMDPSVMSLSDKGKKKNCPKVDYSIRKDTERQCPAKKRRGTRICPGNLLKKKRRFRKRKGKKRKRKHKKKKRTSGIIPPVPLTPSVSDHVRI